MAEDTSTDKDASFFDPEAGALAKFLGVERKEFGVKPEPATDYLGRNVGRGQVLEDLRRLELLRRSGGAATQEARGLQRSQAAGQIALARGGGGGGKAMRLGTESAAQSHVDSMAVVSLIKEAESQGYTREEAMASGLLAMNDSQFRQALDSISGDIERGETLAQQQGKANLQSAFATGLSMVAASSDKSDVRAKTNIRPIAEDAPGDFLRKLNTGSYDYRPEFGGGRNRMGPLLNEEVANTEVGQSFIHRDPKTGYLAVDPIATSLTTMALLKRQDERLNSLEQLEKGRQ